MGRGRTCLLTLWGRGELIGKSQDTNIGIKDLRAKTQLLEENNRDWKITNKAEKYLS